MIRDGESVASGHERSECELSWRAAPIREQRVSVGVDHDRATRQAPRDRRYTARVRFSRESFKDADNQRKGGIGNQPPHEHESTHHPSVGGLTLPGCARFIVGTARLFNGIGPKRTFERLPLKEEAVRSPALRPLHPPTAPD